jgi:hypothetical protein
MNRLATAIGRRAPAFDPAVILQPVEQARQGRAFDPHSLGDFLLSEIVSSLGEVNQRPPFSLA